MRQYFWFVFGGDVPAHVEPAVLEGAGRRRRQSARRIGARLPVEAGPGRALKAVHAGARRLIPAGGRPSLGVESMSLGRNLFRARSRSASSTSPATLSNTRTPLSESSAFISLAQPPADEALGADFHQPLGNVLLFRQVEGLHGPRRRPRPRGSRRGDPRRSSPAVRRVFRREARRRACPGERKIRTGPLSDSRASTRGGKRPGALHVASRATQRSRHVQRDADPARPPARPPRRRCGSGTRLARARSGTAMPAVDGGPLDANRCRFPALRPARTSGRA